MAGSRLAKLNLLPMMTTEMDASIVSGLGNIAPNLLKRSNSFRSTSFDVLRVMICPLKAV